MAINPRTQLTTQLITKLPLSRWSEYRDLRLQALHDCPFAFHDDHDVESEKPDSVWQEQLQKRNIYFCELDGVLVGTAGFARKSFPKSSHVVSILSVYVSPEARGRGIAARLIEAIEDFVRKDGVTKKLSLSVVESQVPALNLYQKLGFVVIGTKQKQIFINGEYLDEHMMEKYLT